MMATCQDCKFALEAGEASNILFVLPEFPKNHLFCAVKFKLMIKNISACIFPDGVTEAVIKYVPVSPGDEICGYFEEKE